MTEKILIYDCTLRDGQQMQGIDVFRLGRENLAVGLLGGGEAAAAVQVDRVL